MTKADLIKDLAAVSGQSANAVDLILNALTQVVSRELENGDEITIPGVAKLSTKQRAARKGRNPKTGEEIDIPEKTVVAVKVLKALSYSVA